jgi:tetratricopeptide (TPR) repeat protein
VHGGVHFHSVDRSAHSIEPIPRQLPGDVAGFVNRVDELSRLNEIVADKRDESPTVGLYVITGTAGVGKTSLALHWAHSAGQRFPDGQLYVNLRGYDPEPPVSPGQAPYASEQATQQETPEDCKATLTRALYWYLHTASAATRILTPQYREQLTASPEEETEIVPLTFVDRSDALQWCTEERSNLTATTRAAADANLHNVAWRLPATLKGFYGRQNHFEDWINTGIIGLDAARRVGARHGEADLLESLGRAYLQSYRLTEATECHHAALTIRNEIGDSFGAAILVNSLGLLSWLQHRLKEAHSHFLNATTIFRSLGDRLWETMSVRNLALVYCESGNPVQASEMLRDNVIICQELGDRQGEGNAFRSLASAQREMGQLHKSLISIQNAITIAQDDNYLVGEGFFLLELARIQRALGQPAEALTACQRSAAIQRQLGDRNREAMALDGTGEAYRELERPDEAAKFHRLAVTIHRETGDRWSLATALVNLATALHESGEPAQARPFWSEASDILAEFDDPKAITMRERVLNLRRASEPS